MQADSLEIKHSNFDAAFAEFQGGNYDSALEVIGPLAEKGDAQSQYVMGTAFSNGFGVTQDDRIGLNWFLLAAEQGLPQAETAAAEMYATGRGANQDFESAWKWARSAAAKGFPNALGLIGFWRATGIGVDENYLEGVFWTSLAAQQGLFDAQVNLGRAISGEGGINADFVQAYKWSKLADLGGHPTAHETLTQLSQNMTRAQIGQASRLVETWSPRALTEEQLKQLARDIETTVSATDDEADVEQEYAVDFENFHAQNIQGAEEGNKYLQTNIGHAFKNGMGVEQDVEQAYIWYMKAAEQGYNQAQYQIGNLHNSGELGIVDSMLALEWWETAANQNYAPAQYNSGLAYFGAGPVGKNLPLAYVWFSLAADSYLEKYLVNRGPDMLLEMAMDAVGARDKAYKKMFWWQRSKAIEKLNAWHELHL